MKINKPSITSSTLSNIVRNYYGKTLFITILLGIAIGLYFVYSMVFPTLIMVEKIDPSEVTSVQETINLPRYERVSDQLEKKQNQVITNTVPDIF